MSANRTLQIALLISFATHVVIVVQNPGYLFFTPQVKSQKIEVNYIKSAASKHQQAGRTVSPKNEPLLNLSSKISMEKSNPPPFIDREALSRSSMRSSHKEPAFDKPALTKPDIIAIKKKITLPPLDIGKISSPSYINYYQVVREKIRRAAYQNYNRNDTGEVYITFIISNAGYLKEVRLVEEKSQAAPYLKEIALQSVRNASPFPNFPKELDYSQLSFNVVISFEVE